MKRFSEDVQARTVEMKTERDELKDELVKARAECESAHT